MKLYRCQIKVNGMNYSCFDNMRKHEKESGYEFMKRIFKTITTKEEKDPNQPKTINDMMEPEFVGCSYEDMILEFKFHVHKWAVNPNGTFHGGLITTACDITMGVLARFFNEGIRVATVEININFMRPINLGEDCLVKAKIMKNGKRVKFTACDIYSLDGKLVATGSGIFM